jgi:hypothetical protein
MRTDTITARPNPTPGSAPGPAARHRWPATLVALMLLTGGFWMAGLAMPAHAHASTMVVDQCNGHGPGVGGATTAMKCTVTVVNTISGTSTYSRTTVTRLCTLGPCSSANGTFVTDSVSLVTVIRQCNTSDNDAAHSISCYVNVVNNIGRGTPGAQPLSPPPVNQCVGSATGGGGVKDCKPASSTGTTLSQCNGSGNGGGGAVHCTVDPQSVLSSAIPITIDQCNGSGNPGGSVLTCNTSIITRITDIAAVSVPKATSVPTAAATQAATPAPSASPTPSQTVQALAPVAATRTPAPSGTGSTNWLMIGAAVVLVAAIGTLLFRRFAPDDLLARFSGKG